MKKMISGLVLGLLLATGTAAPASASPTTKLLAWYQKWGDPDRAYMLETLEGAQVRRVHGGLCHFRQGLQSTTARRGVG